MKREVVGHANVNRRTAKIIHFAGFLIPVVLVLYGVLIIFDISAPTRDTNGILLLSLAVVWIALGVYQFFVPSRSRAESGIRLLAYHLFTMIYILGISGFAMPFIAAWTVLFLASYEFFSRDGLRLSILALFSTAVADTLLHLGDDQYILTNTLVLIATFIIGMITVAISQAQEVDQSELARAKDEGLLQHDRVMTLINNLADAVLSTDAKGIVQVCNAASLGLLDTNAGLVGSPIDQIIQLVDKDNTPFKLSRELKKAKSVVSRDDLSTTISNETIHLSVVYSPVRSTDSTSGHANDGYIIILRDVTKQKSLEEERDEFISVVSHELRTPITITEGTLSNVQLMMSRDDIPKSTLHDNVKVAHEQVLFLAKMVNDLSTLSRAERGVADTPEVIDVSELVHDIYNEYAPQAEAKGLHVNLDLSPQLGSVIASRLYLKELLQNFVTNAIKYTKVGEVLISVTKRDADLHFSVSDTGIGLSKSDQKHVFEKFWRSEDYRTRETGGTGLGLYVARKLAKKLGVTIEMTSRLNHGSTFGFTFYRK